MGYIAMSIGSSPEQKLKEPCDFDSILYDLASLIEWKIPLTFEKKRLEETVTILEYMQEDTTRVIRKLKDQISRIENTNFTYTIEIYRWHTASGWKYYVNVLEVPDIPEDERYEVQTTDGDYREFYQKSSALEYASELLQKYKGCAICDTCEDHLHWPVEKAIKSFRDQWRSES